MYGGRGRYCPAVCGGRGRYCPAVSGGRGRYCPAVYEGRGRYCPAVSGGRGRYSRPPSGPQLPSGAQPPPAEGTSIYAVLLKTEVKIAIGTYILFVLGSIWTKMYSTFYNLESVLNVTII